MSLLKIFRIITGAFALIGIIFGIMIVAGSDGQIDNMLYLAYIVLITILVFVVIFTLKNTFSSAKTLKSTLTGLGFFALVALICYIGFARGVETPLRDGEVLSAGGSKLVGAGLYMFYALVIIASGIILFFAAKKIINK